VPLLTKLTQIDRSWSIRLFGATDKPRLLSSASTVVGDVAIQAHTRT
jgi:hypothetical protein